MVDMRDTLLADEERVREITNLLLHAFNAYLEGHDHTAFPDALMGVTNFVVAILDHQALQMRLSPEQRESYNQAVMGTLYSMLQADQERARLALYTATTKANERKKKKLDGN